jgi:FlaA1/EpsC-like NDP-sugar epimerase
VEAGIKQRFLISRHRLWQVAVDAALVSVALYVAFLWRFDFHILPYYRHLLWSIFACVVVVKMLTFMGFGLYNKWWRYSGVSDLTHIIQATIVASGLALLAATLAARYLQSPIYPPHNFPPGSRPTNVAIKSVPLGIVTVDWIFTLALLGGARLLARMAWERPWQHQLSRDRKRVLVVGAGDGGELVVREMLKTRMIRYQPVGFVDDDPRKKNLQIHGVRVVGTTRELPKLVEEHDAREVIIAIPSVQGKVVQNIVALCKKANVSVKTLPGVYELIKGSVTIEQLRDVQVEDILGRGEIAVDLADVCDLIKGRTILVTGAGGSIGSELCRQIATMNPRRLLLLDHAEDNLFKIHHELEVERHFKASVPLVADVKDLPKIQLIFDEHRPHIIFHAAAYKHVPLMESNCREAFENNTLATLGLAELALGYEVERFVFISTDKAVDPTTVMGPSKALWRRSPRSSERRS